MAASPAHRGERWRLTGSLSVSNPLSLITTRPAPCGTFRRLAMQVNWLTTAPSVADPTCRFGVRATLTLTLFCLAVARLYVSPHYAADLATVPDSVEYAVGAQRIVTIHSYSIAINGVSYPPRYSPWFSLLLAPAYAASPADLGAGIIVVFLFSMIGVAASYRIGDRLAGPAVGAISGAAVLFAPGFAGLTKNILTDAPAVSLMLVGAMVFLDGSQRQFRTWHFAAGGIVSALVLGLRPPSTVIALPFFWVAYFGSAKRLQNILTTGTPILLVCAATLLYQQSVFGDWRRSGYQFWCPVPYDYPSMVFSLRYVLRNLEQLVDPKFIAVLGLGVVGAIMVRRLIGGAALVIHAIVSALALTIFYLFYFYPDRRFHLPIIVFAVLIGSVGVTARVAPILGKRATQSALAVLVVLLLIQLWHRVATQNREPARWQMMMALRQTPDNSILITTLDPVYLEPLVVRGSHRRVVPLSRNVEYASKVFAWKRIPQLVLPPVSWSDHRTTALKESGAGEACPITVEDGIETVVALARRYPVYVDAATAEGGSQQINRLHEYFSFEPVAMKLFRLTLNH
jgi:hypothetical protein